MNVEYKVSVGGKDIAVLVKALGLDDASAQRREVAVFDTPEAALYGKGAILRARRTHGGGDDVTAKVRPIEAPKVPHAVQAAAGFKLEIDRSPQESELTASITVDIEGHAIGRAFKHKDPPHALFGPEQEALIALVTPVPWDSLAVFGPVETQVWKRQRAAGLALEVTLELWHLPQTDVLEISTRVDEAAAAGAALSMAAFLTHLGIDPKGTGQSKTKALVDAFRVQAASP